MEDPERRDGEKRPEQESQDPEVAAPESRRGDPEEETAGGTSEPWDEDAAVDEPGEEFQERSEGEAVVGASEAGPDGDFEVSGSEPEESAEESIEDGAESEDVPDPEEPGDVGSSDGSKDALPDPDELLARFEIKDNHIRELYQRISSSRLAADEAVAAREAGTGHIRALEDERERLKERIRTLEEEIRDRRRRREGTERNVGRLERANERLRAEVARRDFLLRRREQEMEAIDVEAEDLVTRKDVALIDALRRVEGLERDLDERETEVAELRANVDDLVADLKAEYDVRAHLAEPANRLRAGIDLFNESGHLHGVLGLSRTLGQPEVHVDLEGGEEPAVILSFTWQGVSWQTYSANPGLAIEEPRVYMMSAGEDLSGVDRQRPNARIGPGGRVLLGL